MRFLMILSVACLVVAFVCHQVPTQLFGVDALGWLILGLLAWAVDVLLGGWIVALPARHQPPAA